MTSYKKIVKHGSYHEEDPRVVCFVSAPSLRKRKIDKRVSTKLVGLTILSVLRLDQKDLMGAKEETEMRKGFGGCDEENSGLPFVVSW